jgi:hypothetical protein
VERQPAEPGTIIGEILTDGVPSEAGRGQVFKKQAGRKLLGGNEEYIRLMQWSNDV